MLSSFLISKEEGRVKEAMTSRKVCSVATADTPERSAMRLVLGILSWRLESVLLFSDTAS